MRLYPIEVSEHNDGPKLMDTSLILDFTPVKPPTRTAAEKV